MSAPVDAINDENANDNRRDETSTAAINSDVRAKFNQCVRDAKYFERSFQFKEVSNSATAICVAVVVKRSPGRTIASS